MKIRNIFLTIIATLFLSACSLGTSGSDGGIFRSDDGGKSFSQKVNIDEKSRIGGVDALSLAANPQNGNEVYIGTKASGIWKTENGGENWRQLKISNFTPSKVYAMAIDPTDPKIIYATLSINNRGKIIKSEDAGESWKDVYTEPSSGTLVLSLAIDPQNSGYIYAGTAKGLVLLSENGGQSWRNLWMAQAEVYKIAVDSANSKNVYFAVFGNTVLRTKDGGKTIEDLAEKKRFDFNQQNQLRKATAVATDPNHADWVFLGSADGLFRSKDGGENWEAVKILLKPQEQAIRSVSINPQNSDEIVFGASQAFYKSIDGGLSWSTVQFESTRSIETTAYNRQNPATIYVGMNKR